MSTKRCRPHRTATSQQTRPRQPLITGLSSADLDEQDPHSREPSEECLDGGGCDPVQTAAPADGQAYSSHYQEDCDRHTGHETNQQPTGPRFLAASLARPINPQKTAACN